MISRTILNGVHKLPPGHFLRVRANEKPVLERYFYPKFAAGPAKRVDNLENELHATLEEVTAQHLDCGRTSWIAAFGRARF